MEKRIYASQTDLHGNVCLNESLEAYFSWFRERMGTNKTFASPFGRKEIIYADWIASGRAYKPIEEYIQTDVLPFVGNTHTETTITGTLMSKAYEEAKTIIKRHVNANNNDALIFCGSGMTAAVNKLQKILGLRVPERLIDYTKQNAGIIEIDEDLRPVVFITHMEHHSNQVSWLETIATVEIIKPDSSGSVDLSDLERLLERYSHRKNKIAAVTACSNVTGIETPYHEIARMVHRHNGLCFVDFACSAPYVQMDMHPAENNSQLDAIYFSPHKFLGGPGTPGVLIFNKKLYNNSIPDQPGGGTVTYTNPWHEYDYNNDIESREDGGTPPFLQGVKAAMCIKLKEAMGVENVRLREEELLTIAFERFDRIERIEVLQGNKKQRLGIISFMVKGAHHDLFVKMLNDRFGIQTRGGCSCAGTYGHVLLNVDMVKSHEIRNAIKNGNFQKKPGWVRLSMHPTMTNAEIHFILDAIETAALYFEEWSLDYLYNNDDHKYIFNGFNGSEQILVNKWFNASNW